MPSRKRPRTAHESRSVAPVMASICGSPDRSSRSPTERKRRRVLPASTNGHVASARELSVAGSGGIEGVVGRWKGRRSEVFAIAGMFGSGASPVVPIVLYGNSAKSRLLLAADVALTVSGMYSNSSPATSASVPSAPIAMASSLEFPVVREALQAILTSLARCELARGTTQGADQAAVAAVQTPKKASQHPNQSSSSSAPSEEPKLGRTGDDASTPKHPPKHLLSLTLLPPETAAGLARRMVHARRHSDAKSSLAVTITSATQRARLGLLEPQAVLSRQERFASFARALQSVCPTDRTTYIMIDQPERWASDDASVLPQVMRLAELTNRPIAVVLSTSNPRAIQDAALGDHRAPVPIHFAPIDGKELPILVARMAAAQLGLYVRLLPDVEVLAGYVCSSLARAAGGDEDELAQIVCVLWSHFHTAVRSEAARAKRQKSEVTSKSKRAVAASGSGVGVAEDDEDGDEDEDKASCLRLDGLATARVLRACRQALLKAKGAMWAVAWSAPREQSGGAVADSDSTSQRWSYISRFVLLAAYIASRTKPATDSRLFQYKVQARRRAHRGRRGGGMAAGAVTGAGAAGAGCSSSSKPLTRGHPVEKLRLVAICRALIAMTDGETRATSCEASQAAIGTAAERLASHCKELRQCSPDACIDGIAFDCLLSRERAQKLADETGVELGKFVEAGGGSSAGLQRSGEREAGQAELQIDQAHGNTVQQLAERLNLDSFEAQAIHVFLSTKSALGLVHPLRTSYSLVRGSPAAISLAELLWSSEQTLFQVADGSLEDIGQVVWTSRRVPLARQQDRVVANALLHQGPHEASAVPEYHVLIDKTVDQKQLAVGP